MGISPRSARARLPPASRAQNGPTLAGHGSAIAPMRRYRLRCSSIEKRPSDTLLHWALTTLYYYEDRLSHYGSHRDINNSAYANFATSDTAYIVGGTSLCRTDWF